MAHPPRSILITGCSSGIGYDAAVTLHKRGWRVFATCRKPEDCDRLRGDGLESLVLDLVDADGTKAALSEVLTRTGGTLDALYNNAAYALPGATEDYSREALRAIYEVNVIGAMDLIAQVVPVMRAQGHGRIINCGSVLGVRAMRWRGAYNGTKFALAGMTDTLRLEMRDAPIHVSLIEPGPVTTHIRVNGQKAFERWIDWKSSDLRQRYEDELIPRLYAKQTRPDPGELPPSAVTRALIHALDAPRPKARYFVTWPMWLGEICRRFLPTGLSDAIYGRL